MDLLGQVIYNELEDGFYDVELLNFAQLKANALDADGKPQFYVELEFMFKDENRIIKDTVFPSAIAYYGGMFKRILNVETNIGFGDVLQLAKDSGTFKIYTYMEEYNGKRRRKYASDKPQHETEVETSVDDIAI